MSETRPLIRVIYSAGLAGIELFFAYSLFSKDMGVWDSVHFFMVCIGLLIAWTLLLFLPWIAWQYFLYRTGRGKWAR